MLSFLDLLNNVVMPQNQSGKSSSQRQAPRGNQASMPMQYPRMWANGGIAGLMGPELGVVGDQGPEAIVPLNGAPGGQGGAPGGMNSLLPLLIMLIQLIMARQGGMQQSGGMPQQGGPGGAPGGMNSLLQMLGR